MKQQKAVKHDRYNGTNTALEDLNDNMGRMLIDELTFPYAEGQFSPREYRDDVLREAEDARLMWQRNRKKRARNKASKARKAREGGDNDE